eukprot:345196-Pleurochrysis_carterae.AAC.1
MKEKLWQEGQETKQQASRQSKGRRKGKAKALGNDCVCPFQTCPGADEEKENDSVDGGNMPTPLKGDPPPGANPEPLTEKMPADWDGGAFFKVWEILGPFGMNHPTVLVTPKLPSKRPAQEGGETTLWAESRVSKHYSFSLWCLSDSSCICLEQSFFITHTSFSYKDINRKLFAHVVLQRAYRTALDLWQSLCIYTAWDRQL